MKIYFNLSLLFVMILALSACSPGSTALPVTPTASGDQLAQTALTEFFAALHDARYTEAAGLFAGSYEILQGYNPGTASDDYASLLQDGCTINGFQCLPVKSVRLTEKVSDTEFIFKVEFMNDDGSLFVRGPCCGGNETDSPSQSIFGYSVVKLESGEFKVMDLPPYTP